MLGKIVVVDTCAGVPEGDGLVEMSRLVVLRFCKCGVNTPDSQLSEWWVR